MPQRTLSKYWAAAKQICNANRFRGKPRFPTGITFVDEATWGISPGQVWIIAGRPGSGKTSLMMNVAKNIADNLDNKVLILSLEMQGWELALRMYSEMHNVSGLELFKGKEKIHPDFDQIFQKYINTVNLEVAEYGFRIEEVEHAIKKYYAEGKPDVIFLDYVQLLEWRQFGEERIAISEFSRKLLALAKKLQIGIVVVSQLRRLPAGVSSNRPPELSDLKGSGSLEQDAHRVLFIYKAVEEGQPPMYFLNLAKNRGGPVLTKRVGFEGKYYRFTDIEKDPDVKNLVDTFSGEVE